jgi:sec-independent protein translocase protein TatB
VPFDLSMWKLLVLGIIALVVFGPDKLPQIARDAARMVRQLRGMAQAARTELKAELGDTVGDFDLADLNPRAFVRKHLLDDLDAGVTPSDPSAARTPVATPADASPAAPTPAAAMAQHTQHAPYDPDAT